SCTARTAVPISSCSCWHSTRPADFPIRPPRSSGASAAATRRRSGSAWRCPGRRPRPTSRMPRPAPSPCSPRSPPQPRRRPAPAGVGQGDAALEALGGKTRLIDPPELKPLAKFSDQRLTPIAHISKQAQARLTPGAKQIEDGAKWLIDQMKAAGLPDEKLDKV